MPFDLATARPVEPAQPAQPARRGFDLSTARPVEMPQAPQPAQPQRSTLQEWAEAPVGGAELATMFATGALAQIPAGFAGLGTMAGRALGLTEADPADVVRRVQHELTYQPRSESAQSGLAAIARGVEAVERAVNPALAAIGRVSPTAENVVRTVVPAGIEALATVAPLARVPGAAARAASRVRPTVPTAIEATRELVRPSPTPGQPAAQTARAVPTAEELKAAAHAAYKRAEEAGVVVRPQSVENLQGRLVQQLSREGIDPTLHPATTAALRRLGEREGPLTLEDVEIMRRVAKEAEKAATQPADQRLARMLVDELDEFIDGLSTRDVIAGDPELATRMLRDARNLWSRARKAELVEELIDRAQTRAGAHYTQAGMEHALRQEFKALALNKRRMRMFTPQEQAAIKSIARGSSIENTLRNLGKFDPTTGGMAAFISAALGGGVAMAGGGLLGAAVPAIGFAAKRAATRMTARKVDALQELMRRGPEGSVDPAEVMAAARAQPQTAPAAPRGPVAALPPPEMIVTPSGTVARANALRELGLTPDVMRAGAAHPGAERLVDVPPPQPPLALPAPGQVAIPMANDELLAAQRAAQIGLTPDVARAAAAHPGAPRVTPPPPAPPPLALPPPVREQLIVDPAGRVAASPQELSAYRQELGIEGLRGVRQPQMREAPERESMAAILRAPVELRGDELGLRQPLEKMRRNAAAIARMKFAGKAVTNAFDGSQIRIPWSAIKHALSGKVSRNAMLVITRLDEVLQTAYPVEVQADRSGRRAIRMVYHYETPMVIGGQPVTIRSIVREHGDGKRYYDHFELRREVSGEGPAAGGPRSPLQLGGGAVPTGQRPGLPESTTAPTVGEHIVMRGRDVRRSFAPIEHIEVR
jgi:hypothetical protein